MADALVFTRPVGSQGAGLSVIDELWRPVQDNSPLGKKRDGTLPGDGFLRPKQFYSRS